MLGLLGGFCFAAFYAVFGMPVARWADRGNRRTIIALALLTRFGLEGPRSPPGAAHARGIESVRETLRVLISKRTFVFALIGRILNFFVAYGAVSAVASVIGTLGHTVCGSSRRATAIAIVLFSATLVGGGFGPLATGDQKT